MTDLRQQILTADDRPHEDVVVPEWGDAEVRLRGLSGASAEAFARRFAEAEEETGGLPEGIVVDMLIRTMHDPETDEQIFDSTPEDRQALAKKASQVLTRLFRIAQELSGLGGMDEAKND